MTAVKRKTKAAPAIPFLEGFFPFRQLYEGRQPLHDSEQSARWWVRKHKGQLVQAQAVALHRGALMVHLERYAKLAEQEAFAQFAKRAGPSDFSDQ